MYGLEWIFPNCPQILTTPHFDPQTQTLLLPGNHTIAFENTTTYSSDLILAFEPLKDLFDCTFAKAGLVGSGYATLEKVSVQYVKAFGTNKSTGLPIVGLMVVELFYRCAHQSFIPGVVFLRADAVAILITENCDGVVWTCLVYQPRAAAGKWMLELPAGMMQRMENDGEEQMSLTGQAIKELREEVGITIKVENLRDLGTYWPSVGGTKEQITFYHVDYPGMVSLVRADPKKLFGVASEGEVTKRVAMKIDDAIEKVDDAKFHIALSKIHDSSK